MLDGWLDETRISTVGRSHAWARLSYESQRNDKTFLSQELEHLQAPVLPTDVNITVLNGETISFQILSTPPATYYELNDTSPTGLNFNQATGILSGTPSVEGTFSYTLLAANAEGNSTTTLTVNAKSPSSIEVPVIDVGDVIAIRGRSVDLLGELTSSGGKACSITIYYGSSDQNENIDNWDQNLSLPQSFQGVIPATLTNLNSGETYYYRLTADNGNHTSWSDLGSFTTLPYDLGNLTIHTGLDSNGLGAGWFWDTDLDGTFEKILEPTFEQTLYFAPDGSAWTVTKAIFSFNESLVIGSNLDEIILEGANALSIRSTGDITVAHSLNGSLLPSNPHITGGTLTDGYDAFYADSANKGRRAGLGNLGGYGGGKGPGRGISSGSTYAGGASGGGGSNGGEGGPGASGAGGNLYGTKALDILIGGSGGGFGNLGDAGAGGGAMEVNATGKIVIEEGVKIALCGGTVFVHPQFGANFSGGAGSGGSIKLIGSSIENYGTLDVRGGDAAGADSREPGAHYLRHAGGAGGGGRVALISDGIIEKGEIHIDGGKGMQRVPWGWQAQYLFLHKAFHPPRKLFFTQAP